MAEVKYKPHHSYNPAMVMAGLTKYRITLKMLWTKCNADIIKKL